MQKQCNSDKVERVFCAGKPRKSSFRLFAKIFTRRGTKEAGQMLGFSSKKLTTDVELLTDSALREPVTVSYMTRLEDLK